MADRVERIVVTDVLQQTVKVVRRPSDGTVWLHAPAGVVLSADEAWAVAQAMISAEPDEIGPIERCRECGREEWGHSWLDHMK